MTQAGHSERMEMALPGPVVSPSPAETEVAAPHPPPSVPHLGAAPLEYSGGECQAASLAP